MDSVELRCNRSNGSATLMRGKSATCRLRTVLISSGLRPATVTDRLEQMGRYRQVRDLPRIGVAEPLLCGARMLMLFKAGI